MTRYKTKLTKEHYDFIAKYCCTKYNPRGLYKYVIFREDDNIAVVLQLADYEEFLNEEEDDNDDFFIRHTRRRPKFPPKWGCVNMAHQLLVPFEYRMIYDFGHFLIAENKPSHSKRYERYDVYNKKGQKLYVISDISETDHKAYRLLYDSEKHSLFRIAIRKMAISKNLYSDISVEDNGLAFLLDEKKKVGVILFSKLKLPFEYYAVAIPQNGYTLAIKESEKSIADNPKYDCLLIKVRSQLKREDSIHPTGIKLFENKTEDEVYDYFNDEETFNKECNSIICYNQQVNIDYKKLSFFPFDYAIAYNEDEDEEEIERDHDDYNEWEHYTYEDSLYDALGGEMEAYWNID